MYIKLTLIEEGSYEWRIPDAQGCVERRVHAVGSQV